MQVRFQHARLQNNEWGQFLSSSIPTAHHWQYTKLWPGRTEHAGNLGPSVSMGDTTRITIVAGGSRFAILLNGAPVYYGDDPEFILPGELHRLFSCFALSGNAVCEYDNVKYRKLGE